MIAALESCFYEGRVSHRRFTPVAHAFEQRLYMAYLDLSELEAIFSRRLLWSASGKAPVRLRRQDYPGPPEQDLAGAIRDLVAERMGERPAGPIRLLTQLRYLGYGFNPASFFYCFDDANASLRAVVVHVTNTPWGERHSYVVPPASDRASGDDGVCSEQEKRLHVSPFMPMDLRHAFRFSTPGQSLTASIVDRRHGAVVFSAGLTMKRRELTAAAHAKLFLRHPFPGLRTIAGIYFQASRLYLKGAHYHPHPGLPKLETDGAPRWRASKL
jgi:DUF1365 family protein